MVSNGGENIHYGFTVDYRERGSFWLATDASYTLWSADDRDSGLQLMQKKINSAQTLYVFLSGMCSYSSFIGRTKNVFVSCNMPKQTRVRRSDTRFFNILF